MFASLLDHDNGGRFRIGPEGDDYVSRLVPVMRCVRGQMRFLFECAPRFDYGRQPHELELTGEGAVFRTPTL